MLEYTFLWDTRHTQQYMTIQVRLLIGTCQDDEFACYIGYGCVLPNQVCNKVYDCIDSSDEYVCGKFYNLQRLIINSFHLTHKGHLIFHYGGNREKICSYFEKKRKEFSVVQYVQSLANESMMEMRAAFFHFHHSMKKKMCFLIKINQIKCVLLYLECM